MKPISKVVKIGEVCTISPPKGELKHTSLTQDDFVSFLPMEDLGISSKNVNPTKTKTLAEASGSYTYFGEGDILLAKVTPCFENGKLGIATGLTNKVGFGSSEFIVIRPDTTKVVPSYLYYRLLEPTFREKGRSLMVGACGLKRLPKSYVSESHLYLPSISEQKRIVDILDAEFAKIDALKENAEKSLQNAKDLFQAVLRKELEPKEGWKTVTVGDVAELKGGKRVPKGYKLEKTPTPYPYIRVADFNNNGSVDLDDIHYISEEVYNGIKRYIITTNDVYISIAGTIGKSGIIPKELDGANLTENACRLVFKEDINPKYVYYCTLNPDFKEQIAKLTMQAAQPKLALTRLATVVCNIPPRKEQDEIVDIISTVQNNTTILCNNYIETLTLCDDLKQALLRKAFNGEL